MFFATLKRFFLLLLLIVLSINPSLAQEQQDPISRIDESLSIAAENGHFSGVILIASKDEIIFHQAYGYANRETELAHTTDSVFLIGTLTKQFTAMSILILQQRGHLTVQDPICDYLSNCPETWHDITIHHLLNHTSGIPDFTQMELDTETLASPTNPEAITDWFIHQQLDFVAGEDWRYSYSGYILLGQIIAEVSGQTYQDFLTENIFEPLGMEHSGYGGDLSVIPNLANGYNTSSDYQRTYMDLSVLYAAGGLYSTVGDMYLWHHALFNGKIIPEGAWNNMLEASYTIPNGLQIAYGFFMNTKLPQHVIGQYGAINGYSGVTGYFMEENITMILLENVDANSGTYAYYDILTNILFGN